MTIQRKRITTISTFAISADTTHEIDLGVKRNQVKGNIEAETKKKKDTVECPEVNNVNRTSCK